MTRELSTFERRAAAVASLWVGMWLAWGLTTGYGGVIAPPAAVVVLIGWEWLQARRGR